MRCKFFEILAKEKEEIRRRIEEEKDVKVMQRLFLKLKELLKKKEYWTIRDVEVIIKKEFSVEYKRSRLYDLLRELGLKLSKPYILDVKRPDNAEEILAERREAVLQSLKAAGHGIKDFVIGFFDESSPQLSPNTARLWSFKKLKIKRVTTKQKERANIFGFYALNGNSVADFQERSKKENVIEFLRMVRAVNKEKTIVIIIDNFSSHRAEDTRKEAKKLGIHPVFLPTYSPDLNPIEYVWKSLRKRISGVFMESVEELKRFIKEGILHLFKNRGYAKGWIETFSFLFQKVFNSDFCNFLAE